MGAMRGERARSELDFGMSTLMEPMNGKRCQDVCSGIREKNFRKYRKKQYRGEFQEVDNRAKNCRQVVKLMRIPRSEGTGKGRYFGPGSTA